MENNLSQPFPSNGAALFIWDPIIYPRNMKIEKTSLSIQLCMYILISGQGKDPKLQDSSYFKIHIYR